MNEDLSGYECRHFWEKQYRMYRAKVSNPITHTTEYQYQCKTKGSIQSIVLCPNLNESHEKIIEKTDIFFKVGDIMAEEGESVHFGDDIIYMKFKNKDNG
jgi:hypothetical protein